MKRLKLLLGMAALACAIGLTVKYLSLIHISRRAVSSAAATSGCTPMGQSP